MICGRGRHGRSEFAIFDVTGPDGEFGLTDNFPDPDTASLDDVVVIIDLLGRLFVDGFESGDTTGWSETVP